MLNCLPLIEMFQLHFPFQIKFTTPFVPFFAYTYCMIHLVSYVGDPLVKSFHVATEDDQSFPIQEDKLRVYLQNKKRQYYIQDNVQYITVIYLISRGGRKVRLIDLPIPIRSSDCIGRYNRLMPSSDF
jgi:hypothetical protein